MSLYTDTEVQAFDEWLGIGPNAAKNVLDKIAPTIAARALKSLAFDLRDSTLSNPGLGEGCITGLLLAADVSEERADEIEAGQP